MLRKCVVGRVKRPAYFHGWFQYGNAEDGMDGMAIVEFEDGTTDYFAAGDITFIKEIVPPKGGTDVLFI